MISARSPGRRRTLQVASVLLACLCAAGCGETALGGAAGVGGGAGVGGTGATGGLGSPDAGVGCQSLGCDDADSCMRGGTCDVVTGECLGAGPTAANSSCLEDGGRVCDGEGNCVACNTSQDCPREECRWPSTCSEHTCSVAEFWPDGAPCSSGLCIGGVCEAVTNLCPTIDLFEAMPDSVTVAGAVRPFPRIEIAFRSIDLNQSCGEECAPKSCDDADPPNCTPYPSNIMDPYCNAMLGGDPDSLDCLAGEHAGLVCTLAAIASWSSMPTGTFISPYDGVTPVGPLFPINLNTAAGFPGIVLPGLGGDPVDLPPPFQHLPALPYECPPDGLGDVTIELVCGDGDEACVQRQQITIGCFHGDYCGADPRDCSASTDCLTEGVCDNGCPTACDPGLAQYDPARCETLSGVPGGTCDSCPGKDRLALPAGISCTSNGGRICDGEGLCVDDSCATDADCEVVLPTPECVSPPTCSGPDNTCELGTAKPYRTPCSIGFCDGSGECIAPCTSNADCVPLFCSHCTGFCSRFLPIDPPLQSRALTLGCTSNISEEPLLVPLQLDVDPPSCGIISNETGSYELGAVAEFPETLLDTLQAMVPGGVKKVELIDLAASVHVRSGATGEDRTLGVRTFGTTCQADGTTCSPANDQPNGSNGSCVPLSPANNCARFIVLPTSADCSVGGLCDLVGKGPGTSQCADNGFCVTGGLPLPLQSATAEYTADAIGTVAFGFDDQSTGATVNPDGTYELPLADPMAPLGPNSIRLRAGTDIALECTMAVDSNGPNGVGVPGGVSPTPNSELIQFNIQVP